jgi:hypothetical protein
MPLRKPLVNSNKSITEIVGPWMEKLNDHYTYAVKCPPTTDFETHMSRGPKEIQSSREMAGDILKELREHGYYPDISREDRLQFIRLMTDENENVIDLDRGKDTPKEEGKKRLQEIISMLFKESRNN